MTEESRADVRVSHDRILRRQMVGPGRFHSDFERSAGETEHAANQKKWASPGPSKWSCGEEASLRDGAGDKILRSDRDREKRQRRDWRT